MPPNGGGRLRGLVLDYPLKLIFELFLLGLVQILFRKGQALDLPRRFVDCCREIFVPTGKRFDKESGLLLLFVR